MGILETIVRSMTASKGTASDEAAEQYQAQVGVITQLGARVQQQLAAAKRVETGTRKTAIIKLEGDFHRVQERVSALQASVTRVRQQSAALAQHAAREDDAAKESMGYEEFQRHVEFQLQQDVSVQKEESLSYGDEQACIV